MKESGFNPWVRKIPWRRKWKPITVFLSEKSHGQRSLMGYSPWGREELNMTERLSILIVQRNKLRFQFSSVAQSCPTLCNPMDWSTPGFPVHHQLPELTQTHVHQVGDAIQPSHPLSYLSPPAFNLSQHQGLFKWVNSLHEVAQVLEFQLQHQSFQWIFRIDLLQDWLVGSPCSPKDFQESSPTPQSKSVNSSALSFLYSPIVTSLHDHWKNHGMNHELSDVQVGFRKGRGTKDQITIICWIIKKAREFQKNISFCFIDYAKAVMWITTNCGKFWKRWQYQTTWPASCIHVKKQQWEPALNNAGLLPNWERSMSRLYIFTLLM